MTAYIEQEGEIMAGRQRRRTGDIALKIRDAVGSVFSSCSFRPAEFTLPSEKGAQLSMTGEICAVGNDFEADIHAMSKAVRTYTSKGTRCRDTPHRYRVEQTQWFSPTKARCSRG